jgi:Cysteine-rich CPXCG
MEYFFTYPYCWGEISMVLDISIATQTYAEGEVCCNPIEVRYLVEDGAIVDFSAIQIRTDTFHGEWNYAILPRS